MLCVRKLWQKNCVDAGEAEVVNVGEESKKIEKVAEDCALVKENCECP